MTVSESTGAREFRVDFSAQMPGAPFMGPGELVVETAPPDDRPTSVVARFLVEGLDLQARLPRVLKGTALEARGLEIANAAHEGRLIVSFEAKPDMLAELTGGLSSLQALQGYLMEAPAMLDFSRYVFKNAVVESP